MPARRVRRAATLDEFLSAAREVATQARSGEIDVESMLTRLADMIVERSVSRIESMLAERCGKGVDEGLIRSIVESVVASSLEPIIRRLEALEKRLDSLSAVLARTSVNASSGYDRLPAWARRLAKKLEESPYVRLHEENVDVYTVKGSRDILAKLGAVLVETVSGVYLVKREEWKRLLDALSRIKSRDEEEAVRAAGPLAEIVVALLRSNLLYYNRGWRVLPDAYLEP